MNQEVAINNPQNNLIESIVLRIIRLLSIIGTIYVSANTPSANGAAMYFTIPLSFTICTFIFGRMSIYQRGGVALKLFFFFAFLKYIVLPFYTCFVGSFSQTFTSGSGLRYGIILTVIEIFVACGSISFFYKKAINNIENETNGTCLYNGLSIAGVCFIIFCVICLIVKGGALATMRFLVVTKGFNEDDVWLSFDTWIAHTLMAFLVVALISFFHRRELRKHSNFNFILPLIAALLSVTVVFTNNRATMLYYAFSALATLTFAFPLYKRFFRLSIFGALMVVIVSFTLLKQFGVNVSEESGVAITNQDMTDGMSDYLCGVENIDFTYAMYAQNGDKVNVETFISETIKYCRLLRLPGLNIVQKPFKDTKTSIDYATTNGQMVSVAGQTLYYGGYYFGWLLDILAYMFLMKLLVYFDIRAKLANDIGSKYLLTWTSIIFAMSMCYCLTTIWYLITYTPIFLFVAMKINNFIKK